MNPCGFEIHQADAKGTPVRLTVTYTRAPNTFAQTAVWVGGNVCQDLVELDYEGTLMDHATVDALSEHIDSFIKRARFLNVYKKPDLC